MAGNEFLDKQGVATLWERIKQLVYECCCKNITTYRLESDGNTITLIGSDGTRSSVAVISTASCGSTPIEPTIEMSLRSEIGLTNIMTTNIVIEVDSPVIGANVILEREKKDGTYKLVQTWTNQTLTGTTNLTATEELSCNDGSLNERTVRASILTIGSEPVATAETNYTFYCDAPK